MRTIVRRRRKAAAVRAVQIVTATMAMMAIMHRSATKEANDGDEEVGPGECAMCEREMPMTRHHLIPKTTHPYWIKRGNG